MSPENGAPGSGGADADPFELEQAALRPLLAAHIGSARWFRAAGARPQVEQVASLPWLTTPGADPSVRIEMVTVTHRRSAGASAVRETYQVPICYRRTAAENALGSVPVAGLGEVFAHDATADVDALWVLWELFESGMLRLGDKSAFKAVQVAPLDGRRHDTADDDGDAVADHPVDNVPRALTGEQSNTSICFPPYAVLKLFRRVEQGRSLELERLLGMQQKAPIAAADDPAPQLLGWMEADWIDDDQQVWADLGVLTEMIAPATDGWETALDHCSRHRDFTAAATAIGAALHRLHQRLDRLTEPTQIPYGEFLAAVRDSTRATVAAVEELAELGPAIEKSVAALADPGHPVVIGQQLHGDFHLGQVLLQTVQPQTDSLHQPPTPLRARIIDFEGEPMATSEQRRRPGSPARDVAGLLRSFSYLRAASVIAGADPDRARQWEEHSARAFMEGYESTGDTLPAMVLRAQLIEKAVYEVGYEARNRPDWLPMARLSLAELLDDQTHQRQAAP